MKLLAEHYIKLESYEIAQSLCDHALRVLETFRRPDHIVRENPLYRKDAELLKSDIYFILGKIKHIQQNYEQALDFYLKATKLNDKNFAAQFNLGKVYFNKDSYQQAELCFEIVISSPRLKDCFEAVRLLA